MPATTTEADKAAHDKIPEYSNILAHIKALETQLSEEKTRSETIAKENEAMMAKHGRLTAKQQEAMRSVRKSIDRWSAQVPVDDTVKQEFNQGMETLIKNSAEENGVWRMMVAASSLHEQQEHNLDKLRVENSELKAKVDGLYATPADRLAGSKRSADEQLSREDVAPNSSAGMWEDFARDIGSVY